MMMTFLRVVATTFYVIGALFFTVSGFLVVTEIIDPPPYKTVAALALFSASFSFRSLWKRDD